MKFRHLLLSRYLIIAQFEDKNIDGIKTNKYGRHMLIDKEKS